MKNSRTHRREAAWPSAALVLPLLAFSAGAARAQSLTITSCSLGCSSLSHPAPFTCATSAVHVNEEIWVEFSQPIEPASLSPATFQVVDLGSGATAIGTFFVDPAIPERAVFRPMLAFDATGQPVFGLEAGASYRVEVPGTAHDPSGPWITSALGAPNVKALECTVAATLGVLDVVPGSPLVQGLVDVVTAYDPITGDPSAIATGVPAPGASEVLIESELQLVFDDIMNPAPLVDPVTGTSAAIDLLGDFDGDLATSADQLPLAGDFTLSIDVAAETTTVTFTPAPGFPSAGSGPQPRRVVVAISPLCTDLAGNFLANPGTFAFAAQKLPLTRVVLPDGGEDFTTVKHLDAKRTGVSWGGGLLWWANVATPSPIAGGGSGRLGDLLVKGFEVLELDTDLSTFTVLTDLVATGAADPDPAAGYTVTVTDGVFEFASIDVQPSALLRVRGSKPARLFARGEANVAGAIDLAGRAPPGDTAAGGKIGWAPATDPAAFAQSVIGGFPGLGGPGGADGGRGADRPDNSGTDLLALAAPTQGIANPGAVVDGASGGGIAGLPLGGEGGAHWPPLLPPSTATPPEPTAAVPFTGQISFGVFTCETDAIGGAGAGGGFATSGLAGTPITSTAVGLVNPPFAVPYLTPDAPGVGDPASGGDASLLAPAYETLDPDAGLLVGGAGGGGGGAHVNRTKTGVAGACYLTPITAYVSHSGAGGGGGGGALQLQAARRTFLSGVVDAAGGAGGFGNGAPGFTSSFLATPGGGGSGGGILLQSAELFLGDSVGRLDVSGGLGGIGAFGSIGGEGGAGFVRLEAASAPALLAEAPKVLPYEPGSDEFGGADSDLILSGAVWTPSSQGAEALGGAQSCWFGPEDGFFALEFAEDDPVTGVLGWDMDVVLTLPGFSAISWRDAGDPANPLGISLEALLGSDLGGATPSPIAVRFQGARRMGVLTDPCGSDPHDPTGPILPASLTGWVRHPAELHHWFDHLPPAEAAALAPNLIRFQIVFDRTHGLFPGVIAGVTRVTILAEAD